MWLAVDSLKSKSGRVWSVLCDPAAEEKLTGLIFRETTTLGVRRSTVARRTLEREVVAVETRFGPIRVKVGRLNGSTVNAGAEYEDCQRLATERRVPLKQVLAEASFAFRQLWGEEVDAQAVHIDSDQAGDDLHRILIRDDIR